MNRQERRAAASEMRAQAKAWPAHLVEVPRGEWPTSALHTAARGAEPVLELWRSRHYLATVYAVQAVNGGMCRRLTVNRVTIGNNGHWDQDIPWEDLQRCKREAGYGDWYGVEVYPRERDVVNVANMRHLWLLDKPLSIGWFAS